MKKQLIREVKNHSRYLFGGSSDFRSSYIERFQSESESESSDESGSICHISQGQSVIEQRDEPKKTRHARPLNQTPGRSSENRSSYIERFQSESESEGEWGSICHISQGQQGIEQRDELMKTYLSRFKIQSRQSQHGRKKSIRHISQNSFESKIQKSAREDKKKKLGNSQLRRQLIGATNFNIFTTADKNQGYSSKYALFLVLLYLTLLQIKKTFHCSHRVEALMKYIFKQIQKADVKRELKQKQYYSFLTLALSKDQPMKKQNKSQEDEIQQIHSFMRQLMEEERQVATSVFPYYFNLFALVVNKQAIFMDNPSLPLIEYTFQNSRTKRFHRHFTRQDAEQYYREIQALSANQFKQEAE